jgi:hypothetical protein
MVVHHTGGGIGSRNKEALSVDCWFGPGGTMSSPAAIEGSVVSEILGNNFDAELENV